MSIRCVTQLIHIYVNSPYDCTGNRHLKNATEYVSLKGKGNFVFLLHRNSKLSLFMFKSLLFTSSLCLNFSPYPISIDIHFACTMNIRRTVEWVPLFIYTVSTQLLFYGIYFLFSFCCSQSFKASSPHSRRYSQTTQHFQTLHFKSRVVSKNNCCILHCFCRIV